MDLDYLTDLEPLAAVILCTADRKKVDYRMRSKWSRVLRYAAEYKNLDELLDVYIKRKGGINKCELAQCRDRRCHSALLAFNAL